MRVLVTGGAGYLGTVVTKHLIDRGYETTVFDSLLHGGDALVPYFGYSNFRFTKGDIRDARQVKAACMDQDVVIHLAAIVGLPACAADKRLAEQTNFEGSLNVLLACTHQRVLYSSTVSVYGEVLSGLCTEETPAKPLSLYGETKSKAETALMRHTRCTAFRFPTVFGVSPRMRLDLMPNQLTYQAVKDRYAVIYEPEVKRTFIHVQDVARAFTFAIDNPHTEGQIYNPGDESLNISKRGLCDLIKTETGANFFFAEVGSDGDKRNYTLSFDKIRNAGYSTTVSLQQGIREVARAAAAIAVRNPHCNI